MKTRTWTFRRTVALGALTLAIAAPAAADDFQLGDKRMKEANSLAAEVVKERMREERPADAQVLDQVDAADIVVVRGSYDRVEDVLRALGIKHTVVGPEQLASVRLNAKQLLIIDCPGNIGAQGIERVRKFVNAGGYLYTTDWALLNVVQKAFPGYVEFNQHATANDVVEVQVNDTGSNLLRHLTLSKTNPTWWLESSSYPIHVVKPAAVNVLVTSREMAAKYGDAPIAVHFRYGDGQVLHIASHFYLQQNQTRGAAQAKKAGAYLKDDSTLSAGTKAKVESKLKTTDFSDDVVAGDLDSAYSAQQMTSNIVVDRKNDQGRVDGLYRQSLKVPVPTAAPAAPDAKPATLGTGTRVKELERKGDQVKVRTMEGEEAWVPASAL